MNYFFIAVVVLSYLTNELFSWRNDGYLKYFDEFDKIKERCVVYLSAVLFHLGVILFALLSVYWIVGFSF
jgi:hypothetical protein